MEGRTDKHGQTYIPPASAGDNKINYGKVNSVVVKICTSSKDLNLP